MLGTGQYALSLSTGANAVPSVTLPDTLTANGDPISYGGSSPEGDLYEVSTDDPQDKSAARIDAITGGLKKLAEIEFVDGEPHRVKFACGSPHDALIGLLLPRALNVRAVLREEEMAASRGTLVAPSAQK